MKPWAGALLVLTFCLPSRTAAQPAPSGVFVTAAGSAVIDRHASATTPADEQISPNLNDVKAGVTAGVGTDITGGWSVRFELDASGAVRASSSTTSSSGATSVTQSLEIEYRMTAASILLGYERPARGRVRVG